MAALEIAIFNVFCFNAKTGIFSAQVNPALIGTDNRLLKEKDGSPLRQRATTQSRG